MKHLLAPSRSPGLKIKLKMIFCDKVDETCFDYVWHACDTHAALGVLPGQLEGEWVSIYCNNVIYFRISISISPNTPSAILHGLSLLAEKNYSLKHWTWGKKVCYDNFPIYLCVFIWNLRAGPRVEEEFWWKSVVVGSEGRSETAWGRVTFHQNYRNTPSPPLVLQSPFHTPAAGACHKKYVPCRENILQPVRKLSPNLIWSTGLRGRVLAKQSAGWDWEIWSAVQGVVTMLPLFIISQ